MSKRWFQSLTIVSGLIFSVLGYLQTQGLVPEGTAEGVANVIQSLSGLGVIWGLRRAQG